MSNKKKYYLRGLALGIIFTTVVLMIVFKNSPVKISDKEFAKMADKRGYVLKSEADATPTKMIDLEALKQTPGASPSEKPVVSEKPTPSNTPAPTGTNTPVPTATNTPVPTATNTPVPTATNTPIPTATNTPVPTATNTPIPTKGPDENGVIYSTITIYPGETSEIVSTKLFNAGIIANAVDFNTYCFKNNVARYIQIGYFDVNSQMSYNDLVFVLTRGVIRLD